MDTDKFKVAWLDKEYVRYDDARTHVLTQGLNYGGSVFEGIRAYHGNFFKLREHLIRFKKSTSLIGFEIPYSIEEMTDISLSLLEKNELSNAYLRPVAWRGADQLALSNNCKIHCAFVCLEWNSYFSKEAISLHISKWRKAGHPYAAVQSKNAANYAIAGLAKSEAEMLGYDDALMLDEDSLLAEATASNIFIVHNGVLKTPTAKSSLDGITKQTILELADLHDIHWEQTRVTVRDLYQAEEVFVCGTAAEITPVNKVNQQSYEIGEITELLTEAYIKLVHAEKYDYNIKSKNFYKLAKEEKQARRSLGFVKALLEADDLSACSPPWDYFDESNEEVNVVQTTDHNELDSQQEPPKKVA